MKQDHHERARLLLNDLISYSGQPELLVKERCKYSVFELAFLFKQYKDKPLEFYRETDLYIYDLTKYQTMLVPTVDIIVSSAQDKKMKKVLDLDGGIGEYTIRLMQEAGCEVTYLDLKGSKTAEYAAWRFKKYGVKPTIVGEDHDWHHEDWDAVVAMDVLEHMDQETADKALQAMREHATYVFANPEALQYNEAYPQHITRYDMHGFTNIEIDLYKNKSK